MSLIRLALRNARRNVRRTALTLATVLIGTAFTVITLTFLRGIYGGMMNDWAQAHGPVRVVTTEFAAKEILQPLHANIPESDPILQRVRSVGGVDQAVAVIRTGVLVAAGEDLGEDPAVLVGAEPSFYERRVLPYGNLTSGAWLDARAEHEQVVLGGKIARDIGAKVGDRILVLGTTQYGSMAPISADVVGVISGNSNIDAQVYVTLETARWIVDLPEGSLEILVYPRSERRADVRAVADAVRAELGDAYDVEPWMERGVWQGNLGIMDAMEWVLGAVVVFVMALAIFNTMTMSVLERTGEIGVMRAMGQTRAGAVLTFLAEAVAIGGVGGALGALAGVGPALLLTTRGVTMGQDIVDEMGADFPMTATMYGDLSAEILALAVVCGVVTAALGAFFPALRAAAVPPYEAMRARR